MDKLVIAVCAVPTRDVAEELSKNILLGRLAACVSQVDNVRSAYWWRGSIERVEEALLLIKTTSKKVKSLKQFLSENHPYEIPELVFLSGEDALASYVHWVSLETRECVDPSANGRLLG